MKNYYVVDVIVTKTLRGYKRRGVFKDERTQHGNYGIHCGEENEIDRTFDEDGHYKKKKKIIINSAEEKNTKITNFYTNYCGYWKKELNFVAAYT